MTKRIATAKGQRRRARKAARAAGQPFTAELELRADRDTGPLADAFSETPKGRRALERWARRYLELEGAPEGDCDR